MEELTKEIKQRCEEYHDNVSLCWISCDKLGESLNNLVHHLCKHYNLKKVEVRYGDEYSANYDGGNDADWYNIKLKGKLHGQTLNKLSRLLNLTKVNKEEQFDGDYVYDLWYEPEYR